MMEVTHSAYRSFMRTLTRHTKLYTEMVVDDTILHQLPNLERFIGFNEVEHPVAVQLGGDDPEKLGRCAELCAERGYDEINLNCGCPSKRVVSKCFGAKLMFNPDGVRRAVAEMTRKVSCCEGGLRTALPAYDATARASDCRSCPFRGAAVH
jgi:tRNA-dihydrouridine synthase A